MISRQALLNLVIENKNKFAAQNEFILSLESLVLNWPKEHLAQRDLIDHWFLLAKYWVNENENPFYEFSKKLFALCDENGERQFKKFSNLYHAGACSQDILDLMKFKNNFFQLVGIVSKLHQLGKLTTDILKQIRDLPNETNFKKLESAVRGYPDELQLIFPYSTNPHLPKFLFSAELLKEHDIIFLVNSNMIESLAKLNTLFWVLLTNKILSQRTFDAILPHQELLCSPEVINALKNGSFLNYIALTKILSFCEQGKEDAKETIVKYILNLNRVFSSGHSLSNSPFGWIKHHNNIDELKFIVEHEYYFSNFLSKDSYNLNLDFQFQFRDRDLQDLLNLFETGYFKPFHYINLNLTGNQLDGKKLTILAQIISHTTTPDNLHLVLSYNKIGLNELTIISQAISKAQKGIGINLINSISCPSQNNSEVDSLKKNLSDERNFMLDRPAMQVLTAAFPTASKGLCLTLPTNKEGAEHLASQLQFAPSGTEISLELCTDRELLKTIAKSLMCNTTVTKFSLSGSMNGGGGTPLTEGYINKKLKNIINHCCLRNQLILKYPHLESFLKKISKEMNTYSPITFNNQPASLYTMSALHFYRDTASYEGVKSKLPEDITDFIAKLHEIQHDLQSLLPNERFIKRHLAS